MNVHNYYEKLVFTMISHRCRQQALVLNAELFEDAACIALNRLPPRYVRFDIDTTFYLSPEEMADIERKVTDAVDHALKIIGGEL